MGKKGSTQVTPVDPWEVGRADATFNRIDSYTPFGNLTYSGPNRNQANLQLNPYLAGNEERRMLSDRMLLDTALGRQVQMNQGGLPSLTSGINPGALQQFFGLPSSLQTGFDQAPTPPAPPNVIPGSDTPGSAKGGAKGGQLPGPPPGGPATPQKGGQIGGQQPQQPDYNIDPITGQSFMGGKTQAQPTAVNGQAGQPPPMMGGSGGMLPTGGGAKGGMQQAQPGVQGGAVGGFRPGQKGGMADRAAVASGGGQLPQGIDPRAVAANPQGFQEWQQGRAAQQQSQGQPQQSQSGGGLFGGTVGGLIDPNTFGQIGSLDQLQDFDLDRGRVEQSYFDRSASLLNPQYDQAEQRMVSDLRARGIPRDSEAFEREMSNFRRDKGETFSRLADQAVLGGGGEQSRLFGLSSALGDRAQNAQGQLFGMADQLAQRDIQAQLQNANISSMNRATQFNELASLLGLQQVASPGLNNFFAPGNVDMTGAYGLNQQAQMANARNSANMKGGLMGGLGSLGGAALGGPMGGMIGGKLFGE